MATPGGVYMDYIPKGTGWGIQKNYNRPSLCPLYEYSLAGKLTALKLGRRAKYKLNSMLTVQKHVNECLILWKLAVYIP